ncbi:MAG: dicarboxylate/amino acid:cation symporter [Reichenbachiella sp.]|uniref:dicarboxylate/amino acid:cation symporter n=1 Tax=Reichenbachiella sp. TaxID=2184521 RepID=UPI00326305AF
MKIFIGLVLGIFWTFASSVLGLNGFTINWIDPFGTIFIRLLKFIAVPLVLFSIINGVAGLSDISKLKRLGFKTLGIYMVTTVLAISIGLGMVNILKPGKRIEKEQRIENRISYEVWLMDNHMAATADGRSYLKDTAFSKYHDISMARLEANTADQMLSEKISLANAKKNQSPLQFIVDMVPENIILSMSNNQLMLQLIFFAIFFGICVAIAPENSAAGITDFISAMNEIFLIMVHAVMKAAPLFVFALVAGTVAKMADTPGEIMEIFIGLGYYSLTVVLSLMILAFIIYPGILKLFVKGSSYRRFFKNISPAQFLAFSTSSSAATLPVTMECVEEKMGVPKNISSFVLPIGATVNMDGTSLYQAVAVIFLAQLHMIDLTFAQQLTIVLTTTLASIGTAAVPSAGLIMLIIVLQSVGLNPAWIAIIFPVDRILDMIRTTVNVTGDTMVCALVAHSENQLDGEEIRIESSVETQTLSNQEYSVTK